MKSNKIIQVFFFFLIVFSLVSCRQRDQGINCYENFKTRSPVKWVFMLYMNGDNNLEGFAVEDLNELEMGLYNLQQSNPSDYAEVRAVVFFDRIEGEYTSSSGDWSNTRFYEVVPDNNMNRTVSTVVANYEEMDLGDPETLTFFLNKVKQYYPADNYYLDIWNHGGGTRSILPLPGKSRAVGSRHSSKTKTKAASWDDTSGSVMYLYQIQQGIENAGFSGSDRLEVLGFDCCLMGMTEVAYEFRGFARYFVGSMATVLGDGWDYDGLFADLDADSITGRDFAVRTVDVFAASLGGNTNDQTMAASNLGNIAALKASIDALGVSIYNNIPVGAQKDSFETNTRDQAVHFFSGNSESMANPSFDLWDLCDQIEDDYNGALETAAGNVKADLANVIEKGYAGSDYGDYSGTDRGLAIFFSQGEKTDHYYQQEWYSSLRMSDYYPNSNYRYGRIDFCTANGNGSVETWKELFEAWYDPNNTDTHDAF